MNENINLYEILKDCPKGTKFYSSVYGELIYSSIYISSSTSVIYFTNPNCLSLADGTPTIVKYKGNGFLYNNDYGECTIFPSKDQRDWSKFKAPWLNKPKFDPKTLQPFDKVLVRLKLDKDYIWMANIFSYYDDGLYHAMSGCFYKYCIPYNEDTKHLTNTSEEAPEYYRYWED